MVQEIDYSEIRFRKLEKDHWVWLEQGNPEEYGRYQRQVNGLLPHRKGSYLSTLGVNMTDIGRKVWSMEPES